MSKTWFLLQKVPVHEKSMDHTVFREKRGLCGQTDTVRIPVCHPLAVGPVETDFPFPGLSVWDVGNPPPPPHT